MKKRNKQISQDTSTSKDKSLEVNHIDWSTFRRCMIQDLCTHTQLLSTGYIGKIKLEDAIHALHYPETQWRVLLAVSKELMHCSPHYFRLNSLYSNMALFNWWLDLYDVKENVNEDTLNKTYKTLAVKLENMNIKHEFGKIMKVLPYQDIFCGLVMENAVDFFIQEINYGVCRLYQIQDGLYNFDIDLSRIKETELKAYPDYVQDAWLDWTDGKQSRWYLPPADKQVCIKLNSQWTYPFPLLIGLIKDILDLDIYKKLKLQSAKTDNYKAIMMKVPIDEDSIDKPLLTPETLSIFAEINRESLSEDIGLLYTLGSDGEAISFKDSNNTTNNVSDAIDELYNSSGNSQQLFNGSASGTAVTLSVENDAGFVYGVYRQFERWVNRYIKLRKYNKTTFKFRFYLLDTTIFNRDNVTKRYKEACTLGATVVDKWLASMDMTPARTLGSYILHKNIFDFQNNFISLSSSFNSSSTTSGEAGRPTAESKGELLSPEGERMADSEKNDR